MDYYQILGVARSATTAEIKQQYRRLALKHHPDVCSDRAEGENAFSGESPNARFARINVAYRTLVHEDRRTEYDRSLRDASSSSGRAFGANGQGQSGAAQTSRAEIMVRARQAAARGFTEDARRLCLQVLSRNPQSIEALVLLRHLGYMVRIGPRGPETIPLGPPVRGDTRYSSRAQRKAGAAAGRRGKTGPPGSRTRRRPSSQGPLWTIALLTGSVLGLGLPTVGGPVQPCLWLGFAAAGMSSLLMGTLLARQRLLPPASQFLRQTGAYPGAGLMLIGLAGLAVAQFWVAVAAYGAICVLQGRTDPRISMIFGASVLVTLVSIPAAGDAWAPALAFAGDFSVPALIIGWMLADIRGGYQCG